MTNFSNPLHDSCDHSCEDCSYCSESLEKGITFVNGSSSPRREHTDKKHRKKHGGNSYAWKTNASSVLNNSFENFSSELNNSFENASSSGQNNGSELSNVVLNDNRNEGSSVIAKEYSTLGEVNYKAQSQKKVKVSEDNGQNTRQDTEDSGILITTEDHDDKTNAKSICDTDEDNSIDIEIRIPDDCENNDFRAATNDIINNTNNKDNNKHNDKDVKNHNNSNSNSSSSNNNSNNNNNNNDDDDGYPGSTKHVRCDSSLSNDEENVHYITTQMKSSALEVAVTVDSQPIRFVVTTGSPVSIMTQETLDTHFPTYKTQQPDILLKTYDDKQVSGQSTYLIPVKSRLPLIFIEKIIV